MVDRTKRGRRGTAALDPQPVTRKHSRDLLWESLTTRWKRGIIPPLHE